MNELFGAADITSVGGADGLIWVLSRDGLMFRDLQDRGKTVGTEFTKQ